ncbi:MAG: HIT family protein [bacterium]|nr:HIT family protein [bacterium]
MSTACLICERIQQITTQSNPYFVRELETGYAVIGDYQFFRGYSLFLCNRHVPELHCLEPSFKMKFLEEMSLVAQAVYNWVMPVKLNYELLGNAEPHLHWHFFPRHHDDPNPQGPTWQVSREIRYAETWKPSHEELRSLTSELNRELTNVLSIPTMGEHPNP